MLEENTVYNPHTGRRITANADWVLIDQVGKPIAFGDGVKEVRVNETVNSEGQTQSEWKADLRKRQREELFGELSEFATDGVGYMVTGLVVGVKAVFHLLFLMSKSLSKPPRQRPSKHYSGNGQKKSTVNVNVEVNGNADVNVNVKVNN